MLTGASERGVHWSGASGLTGSSAARDGERSRRILEGNVPSDVKRRGFLRSTGKDERFQRLELAVARVDRALKLSDAIIADASLREMLLHLLLIRSREQSADAEQVSLDWHEHFVYLRHRFSGASETDKCIELIDIAVRFDARMILRNAAATEESGCAFVAALRVNLHDL